MNGDFQSSQHLLIRSFSYHIFCDKLVFQPIIQQVFCRNTTIEESLDFLYHPILQTLFQPAGDFITAGITVDTYSYHQRINRRQFPLWHRMFKIVSFNLNRTDGTLRSIYICAIVHIRTILRLQIHQHICQFFQRFTFERNTKSRILRNRRKMITFQDRLNIESGTSTEYRKYATMSNVLIGIIEVLLILEEIILGTGITDVYQMIRNQLTLYRIILKIFSRTNIHAPIYLATIGTDNLSTFG